MNPLKTFEEKGENDIFVKDDASFIQNLKFNVNATQFKMMQFSLRILNVM